MAKTLAWREVMHWAAILSALTLALSSSFLVIVKGWTLWDATLLVGGLAIGIIFVLLILLLLLFKNDREALWLGITSAFRSDLNGLFGILGIKKRF
jgi:hypothetical protein